MKTFSRPIIASVIIGAIALVLGYLFIGIVVQTVTNTQLGGVAYGSFNASNWTSYSAAYSVVQLVPMFNALLMLIVAVVIAIGFLKSVGIV